MFSVRKGRIFQFLRELGTGVAGSQSLRKAESGPVQHAPSAGPNANAAVSVPLVTAMSTPTDEWESRRSLLPQKGWSSGDERKWYTAQFRDLQAVETDPESASGSAGTEPPIDPHPLFSSDWYCRRYVGASTSGLSAVEHYVRQGASQGKVPHPVFEMRRRYGRRSKVVRPEAETSEAYLLAAKEAVDSFFDEEFFAKRYPQIAKGSSDLFREFVVRGAVRLLDPHPLFWTEFYCQQVTEPIGSSLEAVAHYVIEGADSGYDPHPLFNSRYYQEQQLESDEGRVNPLWHFLASPNSKRHRPNPSFDPGRYLQLHPDVAAADTDPLLHYMLYGAVEGRELG